MSKQNILIATLAGIVLYVVGFVLKSGTASLALLGLGALAFVVAWIMGLVKTAQLSRWGWFVAVLLLGAIGTLIYGIAGPETKK